MCSREMPFQFLILNNNFCYLNVPKFEKWNKMSRKVKFPKFKT